MKASLLLWLVVLRLFVGEADALDHRKMKRWDLVIAPDAAPAVRYAAEEFRKFFAEATGHTLPVVEVAKGRSKHIFIGPSPTMLRSSARLDTSDLGEEDLRIAVARRNIAICGGSPRGTLYGVYTYLEDLLGVRFVAPGHVHVPKVTGRSLVPRGTKTFRPKLSYRCCYYGPNHHHHNSATRLRNNAFAKDERLGGRTPWRLINHSLSRYVPVRKYGKEHPDYFALVDGKRRSDVPEDHYGDGGTQPCMTNPDVKRLVIEGVLRDLGKDPERVNISVSQNDNKMFCRCDRCKAIDDREESNMGALLTLVNEVAGAAAQEHPGVCAGTLSYQYSRKPPKHLRPRENVEIQLCSIEACQLHPINDPNCPRNRSFCEHLAGWGKICNRIYIWNYNTNFSNYLLPCPNLRVIGPNVRYFVANNAKGLFMQAAGNARAAELSDLRNYIISNLMWDPSRDDKALMEEFLTLHYGRAAGPIRDYISLIHDNAAEKGLHHHCYAAARDYGVDEAIVEKGMALFEKAMQAAETDEVRRRVEKASLCMHRASIEPLAEWLLNRIFHPERVTAKVPAEMAKSMRPKLRKFIGLCEKHGVNWFNEWVTFDKAKQVLREGLGLKPDEAW